MKKTFLLSILLIISISCSLFEGHYHDGKYIGDMGFFEINLEINGNEMIVNHSLAGTAKLECEQFKDYIEVVEPDGVKKIMKVLENGDLEYSAWLILKKVDSEGSDIEKETIKRESFEKKSIDVKEITNTSQTNNKKKKNVHAEIINPKLIIRNKEQSIYFKKIIETKDKDFNIQINKEEHFIDVIPKSENIIYTYIPYTESIEGFTYYSDKDIDEVKKELKRYGVEFYNEQIGYIDDGESTCYSVIVELVNENVKISYGYECD